MRLNACPRKKFNRIILKPLDPVFQPVLVEKGNYKGLVLAGWPGDINFVKLYQCVNTMLRACFFTRVYDFSFQGDCMCDTASHSISGMAVHSCFNNQNGYEVNVMNDDFVKRLQRGGVDIYGDNGELMACASPEVLADFLDATNARHFSHYFNPSARYYLQPKFQQPVNKTEPTNPPAWEAAEGHFYAENHELVAILPAKLTL